MTRNSLWRSDMRSVLAAMIVAAGAAGGAWAQGGPQEGAPLGGPEVRERRPPGAEQPFGSGAGQRRAQGLPHRAFMEAIRPLRRGAESDAPRELRLTEEQDEQIAALDAEYSAAMRRAMSQALEEMGVEVDRPRRGEGRGVPEGRPPAGRLNPEQRARAAELMQGAPRAADWHTKMFAVLREPQQEFVKGRLQEIQRRADERRGQAEMERRLRERAGADAAPDRAAPEGRPAPGAAGPQRERLRRIAELMSQLPPEEREQILSRIERELERRVQERPDGADAPREDGMEPARPADPSRPARARTRRTPPPL